jgi:hypothetical protein
LRCVKCGTTTRVTDSRDDRNNRNDWLVKYGDRVFGWWSQDFRLRKRTCLDEDCAHKETTIEITLDDLEDSLNDLRKQLLISAHDLAENEIPHLSQDSLDALASNLEQEKLWGKEVEVTKATLVRLVSELKYRRERQQDAL